MTLTFYSLVLNHHQAWVADEFYKILGNGFNFVELDSNHNMKGANIDFSTRPYLIKAWESSEQYQKSMALAKSVDVCVFAGFESLPFEIERLKLGLLSFDMGERWLKRGLINLLSPNIFSLLANYHLRGWHKRPLYKLCCSAFTKKDCSQLFAFGDKCYKWGYFTKIPEFDLDRGLKYKEIASTLKILWVARFLKWKHPERMLQLGVYLKKVGYTNFEITMVGDGPEYENIKSKITQIGLTQHIKLTGALPNNHVLKLMREHDVFCFTSDRNEGWGAVANEAMSNGCVLVASDAIGSTPYLIKDGVNGFVFNNNQSSLNEKVEWLLKNMDKMQPIQNNAIKTIIEIWSPKNAAASFIHLIDRFQNGLETDITDGPCSKA